MPYLKRSDIKPENAVEQYHALMRSDVQRFFFMPGTKQFRKATCKKVPCPLCGEVRFKEAYRKEGFVYGTCPRCNFFYVNPRPTAHAIEEYYNQSKASAFFQKYIIEPTIKTRIERIFKPRLKWLNKMVPRKGALLDIGCSVGIFLELAKKNGWKPYGIEFSPDAVEACRKKGITISMRAIEQSDFAPNMFDVITLFEVLEHVALPKETLQACMKHLKPGGMLIITVPNIEGIEFQILGPAHTNIAAPAHLNFFSPSRLRDVLLEIGFQVPIVETPGELDIDNIRDALVKKRIKTAGHPFWDALLRDETEQGAERRALLQTFVRTAGLSGHLRVVAIKPKRP